MEVCSQAEPGLPFPPPLGREMPKEDILNSTREGRKIAKKHIHPRDLIAGKRRKSNEERRCGNVRLMGNPRTVSGPVLQGRGNIPPGNHSKDYH
jgi:hypothetical protein